MLFLISSPQCSYDCWFLSCYSVQVSALEVLSASVDAVTKLLVACVFVNLAKVKALHTMLIKDDAIKTLIPLTQESKAETRRCGDDTVELTVCTCTTGLLVHQTASRRQCVVAVRYFRACLARIDL